MLGHFCKFGPEFQNEMSITMEWGGRFSGLQNPLYHHIITKRSYKILEFSLPWFITNTNTRRLTEQKLGHVLIQLGQNKLHS